MRRRPFHWCAVCAFGIMIGPVRHSAAEDVERPAQNRPGVASDQVGGTGEQDQRPLKAPVTLDEVVITATRRSARPFNLAFTTQTVTSDSIRGSLFRTTPEALREVPGVMVQ